MRLIHGLLGRHPDCEFIDILYAVNGDLTQRYNRCSQLARDVAARIFHRSITRSEFRRMSSLARSGAFASSMGFTSPTFAIYRPRRIARASATLRSPRFD